MCSDQELVEKMREHLEKCSFAPILENSKEKYDVKAVKLMFVVDFFMTEHNLYEKINPHPKMLNELLQFNSYGSFKYYGCQVNRRIDNRLLKCTFCELIGPYALVITHIAINHNAHISLKQCAYCKRDNLISHVTNNSLDTCYNNYLQKHGVNVTDDNVSNIVVEFYTFLRNLAKQLDVLSLRSSTFSGIGNQSNEKLNHNIRNFPTMVKVFKQKGSKKVVNNDKLDRIFERVVEFTFGGNGISRLMKRKIEDDVDIMSISSDEDDENDLHQRQERLSTANNVTEVSSLRVKIERTVEGVADSTSTNDNASSQHQQLPVQSMNNKQNDGHDANEPKEAGTSHGIDPPQDQTTTTTTRTITEAGISASAEDDPDIEPSKVFGQFVANRVSGIRNNHKRRKLELRIQQCIINAEMEVIDDVE